MPANSIHRNPAGWARTVAGTKKRYRLTSAAVAAAGVLLLVFTFLPNNALWLRLVTGFITVVAAVEFPLYCLRAIHAVVDGKDR